MFRRATPRIRLPISLPLVASRRPRRPSGERRRFPRQFTCFDRGLSFLADKQYQLALSEWERALELDPNNRMYQTNLKRLRARL